MPAPVRSLPQRALSFLGGSVPRSPEEVALLEGYFALLDQLALELTRPDLDLGRLAGAWVEIATQPHLVATLDPRTRRGVEFLRDYGAPVPDAAGPASAGPLLVCLPVALKTLASPTNLVSGTYHLGALLDPDPVTLWSAVAINVTAARFLLGSRDFVGEAIDALRANEAPDEIVETVGSIPRRLHPPERSRSGHQHAAVRCLDAVLWHAYHEPLPTRGLARMATGEAEASLAVAIAGALFGARDGTAELQTFDRRESWSARLAQRASDLIDTRPTS